MIEKGLASVNIHRFIVSTASQSSPSNTDLRPRKRSRTSSAGGDSLAVHKECGNVSDEFDSKSKPRSAKWDVRLLPGNLRSRRKPAKSSRVPKPYLGNLQNAIVLAPFHTLKRCFQNKLVDLYSFEKMKKIFHKTKMTKKQNMSFEYDIIELNQLKAKVKKEGKVCKKPKQKSRSPSYCQCNKIKLKADPKLSRNILKEGTKISSRELLTSRVPHFSRQSEAKRRKVNDALVTPPTPKTELTSRLGFQAANNQFTFADVNLSASIGSSRSKCDSWETRSNSPSCKEELMEGSLAISTTSFDSYFEQFEKGSCDYFEGSRRCSRRGYIPKTPEIADANFLPKPDASSTKHFIMNTERKDNDGEIVDFMDREPQAQLICSIESNQHLQPLRRQGRTKSKKPENESATGYCLRSLNPSKERISPNDSQAFISKDRRECRSSRGSTSSKNKTLEIEAVTQVEGSSLEKNSSKAYVRSNQEDLTTETCFASFPLEQAPESSSADVNQSVPDSETEPSLRESASNSKPSCEIPCTHEFDPAGNKFKSMNNQQSEEKLSILEEHSDRASIEIVSDLHGRFHGSTNPQQTQDKESDFIFGMRKSPTRFEDSCDFSSGFKWVVFDDED